MLLNIRHYLQFKHNPISAIGALLLLSFLLSACGGGGSNSGGGDGGGTNPPGETNKPPVANAGTDQTVNEGTAVTLDGSASSDPDGTLKTYSWKQTAGTKVELTKADTAKASFTAPAVKADESLSFELTVTDEQGATATSSTQVTVKNVNQAPIANAGADQTVNEGTAVTLDGSASSDPDGTIKTYSWKQTAGTTVELTQANTAQARFTAPNIKADEILTFNLEVTDNQNITQVASVNINVKFLNKELLNIISPLSNTTTPYNRITINFTNPYNFTDIKVKNLSISNDIYLKAVNSNNNYYIYNIPLIKGTNNLQFFMDDNYKQNLTINSENKELPLSIQLEKTEGFESLNTIITAITDIDFSKILIDKENNGKIDVYDNKKSNTIKYNSIGRYYPTITIKSNELLYSSLPIFAVTINEKPTESKLTSLATLNAIDMQGNNPEKYYILSNDNYIYEIDNLKNTINNKIIIPNANNPQGFYITKEEDIYIANTGNNEVIKLSKANNYQVSMKFGNFGIEPSQFNHPIDLVVANDGQREFLYILDDIKKQIQVYDTIGKWLFNIDGSNTKLGKFVAPNSINGYFNQPLTITDNGNHLIRMIQIDKTGKESDLFVLNDSNLKNFGKATITENNIIVPEISSNNLYILSNKLNIKKNIPLLNTSEIAITQNLLNYQIAYTNKEGINNLVINTDPPNTNVIKTVQNFTKAVIENNKIELEKLLGYDSEKIDKLYSDTNNLNQLINYYKAINSWEIKQKNDLTTDVLAHISLNNQSFNTYFQLMKIDDNNSWIIVNFY